MTLGEQLKTARKAAGISQDDLAKRCGLKSGRSYISRIESGAVTGSLEFWRKASSVLDCGFDLS